ncbi:MAG: hypothetical protein NDJ89_15110 [Oligoflexia bacterium]|nr:hypothetical protein [Oligoflexia bacterium]
MSQAAAPDRWLVRTEKNQLQGPFGVEELRRLIQDGKLGPQDEVCRANSYWITLHERDEVRNQLGIDSPKSTVADDEEITQTDAAYRPLATESRVAAQGAAPDPQARPAALAPPEPDFAPAFPQPEPELPELSHDELQDALNEDTAVLSNRALREFQRKNGVGEVAHPLLVEAAPHAGAVSPASDGSSGVAAPGGPTSEKFFTANVTSAVEGATFWQSFPWALVLLFLGLLGAAVYLLTK